MSGQRTSKAPPTKSEHGDFRKARESLVGQIRGLTAKVARLEASGPTIRAVSNGDDSSGYCDGCDQERDEPHTWAECVARLRSEREAAVDHAIDMDAAMQSRGSGSASPDDGMLMKLRWLRDTVGVDIERMFARAQKEKDGRDTSAATPAEEHISEERMRSIEDRIRRARTTDETWTTPADVLSLVAEVRDLRRRLSDVRPPGADLLERWRQKGIEEGRRSSTDNKSQAAAAIARMVALVEGYQELFADACLVLGREGLDGEAAALGGEESELHDRINAKWPGETGALPCASPGADPGTFTDHTDSPNFTPPSLAELAKRNYQRVNAPRSSEACPHDYKPTPIGTFCQRCGAELGDERRTGEPTPVLYDTVTAEADMRRALDTAGEVASVFNDDSHGRRSRIIARAFAAVRLDERRRSEAARPVATRAVSATTTSEQECVQCDGVIYAGDRALRDDVGGRWFCGTTCLGEANDEEPRTAEAPPPWPAIGDHVDMTKAVLVDFHGRSGKVEELRPNEARIRWDTWGTTDWVSVRDLRRRERDPNANAREHLAVGRERDGAGDQHGGVVAGAADDGAPAVALAAAPADVAGPNASAERGPMLHKLKTHTPYFHAITDGPKTFEVRKNDRDFRVGDVLRLEEWNPGTGYTGAYTHCKVMYLAQGVFGLPADVCVMAIGFAFHSDIDAAKGGAA